MLNLPLARERLYSQWIDPARSGGEPAAVVRHLGGMQGQEYAQAVWAIGVRCGASLAQVEADIRARKIARLWLMRQTIHFASVDDIPFFLSLTRPRMLQGMATRLRELALDAATLEKSSGLLVNALRAHGELDRAALFALLDDAGISPAGQRGYYMLGYAGMQGWIAMGVESRKNPVFFALEAVAAPPTEDALRQVTLRYFAGHAPATLDDLVRWLGITLGEARRGLALCEDVLTPPDADGMIRLRDPDMATREGAQGIDLLPGFDEYFIGYKERGAMLDPAHADKICPGGNGVFKPMIVCDGEICGVWSRAIKRDQVLITPAPFRTLSADERDGVEAAAMRYGAFLGMDARVQWDLS